MCQAQSFGFRNDIPDTNAVNLDSLADRLKKLVEIEIEHRGRGAKAALAKRLRFKSQSTITQWMSGDYTPGINHLESIAAWLGRPLAEILQGSPTSVELSGARKGASVHQPGGVTSSDPPMKPQSPSITSQGGVHGVEVDSLRQELADIREKYDRLRSDIAGWVLYFGAMGEKDARAASQKSAPGKVDRGHDRQLSGKRHNRR
jgi:transcriptional regulator with XRE-family HTH domain